MGTKISELTALTTPLESDVVAIVNSSETKKVRLDKVLTTYYPATTLWDDMRVAIEATKLKGAKDPDYNQFKDDGSGSVGVFTYLFDSATEEEVFFSVQVPHSYKLGTDFHPHVHWTPTSTSTGSVTWGLEYTIADINETFGNTNTITGSDAAEGAYKHQLCEIGTISGTTQVSAMMACRLFRNATSTGDTYGSDAAVLEFDIHFEIDSNGSKNEYSK